MTYTLRLLAAAMLVVVGFSSPAAAQALWGEPINTPGERFIVLESFNNEAVFDKETGLVWERNPLHPQPNVIGSDSGVRSWSGAHTYCISKRVGDRRSWRLPTVQELSSLIDPTVPGVDLNLPAGHPFLNVDVANYWTATLWVDNPSLYAWVVIFAAPFNTFLVERNNLARVWCVRAGQGTDLQ